MAQTKTIQLLRSSQVYANLEAAKTGIQGAAGTRQDGELLLGRYWSGTGASAVIKSVVGIYHKSPDLTAGENDPTTISAGWTFIQDITSSNEGLQRLQYELDATQTGAGLNTNGSYAVKTGDTIIGESTSIAGAVNTIADYIQTMNLEQVGGTSGDVITTVSQADGKVSANKSALTDVAMTGYAADSAKTGAITATDTLEQAFNKVENAIAANEVASTDGTITVTHPTTGTNEGKTDLAVNVDGKTLVKSQSTGTISSALKVVKVIPSGTAGTDEVVDLNLATNVKEAYRLVYDGSTTAIGQQINVYKDSSLKEVYLGASTDTIDPSTGVITKNTVTDPQSMNFAYQLADGTYSLVKIDVSKFLTDSEFKDGLQVVSGVVSVKKDTSSGKVRTAATPSSATPGSADDTGLVDVLTVSSNGVKVDNIQAAIDYAVQNSSTSLAISAEGDNYITASVDANNNKKINVTADVQSLTATAGTAGTYDANGAQTAAPTHGNLSGVAKSLGDAADIATKVKTYVDGEIAIEAARSDAKNKADLKTVVEGLDGTATASSATNLDTTPTADFKVLTKVAEVDGKVVETTVANGSTAVTLKKLAATGAAADVSVAADTTSGLAAGNVQNTLEALTAATNNGLDSVSSGNAAIAVGNKTNKSQTVSLVLDTTTTTGNITSDMLEINSNGLMMKDTWDCGVF